MSITEVGVKECRYNSAWPYLVKLDVPVIVFEEKSPTTSPIAILLWVGSTLITVPVASVAVTDSPIKNLLTNQ